MSDDRYSLPLREAEPPRASGVFKRLWSWLRAHFPLVVRPIDYADAKIDLERAKAEGLRARADLDSAKARRIDAETRVRLSDLRDLNEEMQKRSQEADTELLRIETVRELQNVLARARSLGMQISIEQLPLSHSDRLLPRPETHDEADGEVSRE